jgi:hypothetical protein
MIYNDASATGRGDLFSGLETMFGVNGTINISSGAQRAANAADIVGSPNDTYGTLLTNLGNYAGEWQTQSAIDSTWPNGAGDAEFEFWAPIVLNYTSTAWAGTTNTWASNGPKVVRFAISSINDRVGADDPADMVLLNSHMFRQWKDSYESLQRITPLGQELETGFPGDRVLYDGAVVTSEYGVTPGVGYVLSMDNMEYHSMYDTIFKSEGPAKTIGEHRSKMLLKARGQFKFRSPKHFAKLAALA